MYKTNVFLTISVAGCIIKLMFPNSLSDRGSNRENSVEACCFALGRRLEKGFREAKNAQNVSRLMFFALFIIFLIKS